jgi:Cu2+-exporting ATPase
MAKCEHCGTDFAAGSSAERYCCRGCEYVAELISDQGFERFYDLKQGLAVAPVKSRPFEQHDFGWLGPRLAEAEQEARAQASEARLDLGLEGISCVGCVWLIEKLFSRHPGSIRVAAHPASGRLHLEWLPGKCDVEAFLRELCQFGYVAAPRANGGGDVERRRLATRMGLCAAFALNTMAFSLPMYLGMPASFEFAGLFKLIAFLSATLSMLVGAAYFMDRAWRAVRAGSLHIDLPIALGLIAAYIGSIVGWVLDAEKLMYFDFVSIFVFLMLAGRFLQTAAVDRNRRRLVRRQPVPEMLPLADGSNESVARDAITPGIRFRLMPGQALPVSGVLALGEADFSLEWIHGEADPVRFEAGSRLPAGAILLSRKPADLSAVERWEDSLLAKLTAPVKGERGSPGLDRLLKFYLGIVLILGVVAFAIWGLQGEWLTGTQAMISVFVVSCPCALGVAIPLADDLAATSMERLGVFVRNATIWPRLRRVRKVIFDKTGTLTCERPAMENPDALTALDDDEALALARMTRGSLHPVSRSLLEGLGLRGQKLLAEHGDGKPTEHPGFGVSLDNGEIWTLGKAGWKGEGQVVESESGSDTELRKEGELRAAFRFRETLRSGAQSVMQWLERHGLALHILSGDHPEKVGKMADLLRLPANNAHGGLSPEDKAARVKALDRQDTLYLGDGANDSLAFDSALVTGTPVVDRSLLESKADFYTLGSGLGFLPGLLDTARARTRAVQSAFAFAMIYNVTTIAFSMAGHMSPLLAAVLMPLSSIVSIVIIAVMARGNFADQ